MSIPPRKCRRDGVEGAIQSRRVAPLDFRAEGRAEHQPVSGVASADAAGQGDRLQLDVGEAGRLEIVLDARRIDIAEWTALHVRRGSSGNSAATAFPAAFGTALSSRRSKLTSRKWPSERSTRRASSWARTFSGKNIT